MHLPSSFWTCWGMPSTVVLLSFLFLPAFSEDLEKESCGRKVEPVKGVSESSWRDMSPGPCVPDVRSPVPAAAHTPGTAQGASTAKQGGDAVSLSVPSPSSIAAPVAASDSARAALFPPKAPRSLQRLMATQALSLKAPRDSCHAPQPLAPTRPLAPQPGTFPLDHLGADGEGVLRGAVGDAGSRPAP